jgi:hypothetical protein
VRRLPFSLVAAALLAVPASASAAARLPDASGGLVALAAGPGAAYAVVATGARARPFRLVRSDGRRATGLRAFGVPGADYADVAAGAAGPLVAFARPTTSGYAYESIGFGSTVRLGQGTGAPVLALDGTTRIAAYPDDDGDATISRDGAATTLTSTGPALRNTPLDVVVGDGGPLLLVRVQSRGRSQLRVLGAAAPARPVVSVPGLRPLEASITSDGGRVSVAYRDGARRLVLASAAATATARWSRRRLRVRGALNGAPAVARVGARTCVATSQRVGRRSRIFLTTVRPAGAVLRPLTRAAGSDLAPLAATGPDGRVYVAWTHRPGGRSRRAAVLRRVL